MGLFNETGRIERGTGLAAKFAALWSYVNERLRRLILAAEPQALGREGVSYIAAATGVSWATVHKRLKERRRGGPGARPGAWSDRLGVSQFTVWNGGLLDLHVFVAVAGK